MPPTTEISTLSLHDALPISAGWARPATNAPAITSIGIERSRRFWPCIVRRPHRQPLGSSCAEGAALSRSEEHTSELQSHSDLVCRLLLEKKKKKRYSNNSQR